VSGGYRFGYQGSEKDNELKGQGNSYTTEFRQLDPRLGRWLSVDPVFYNFPNFSPFVSMLNNSLIFIDKEGDIVVLYDIQGNKVATISKSEIIVEKGMENSNFIMQYNEAKNYITSYCQNDVFSYLENDERILEIHASDKMDKVGAFRNSGVDIKGEQYVTINNMEILQKFDNVEYKDKKNIGKIFWSPNLGGIDFEDNNHSPAMVLLHEMIHAKHFAENVTQYVKDRNDYNSKKDNQEELKTIKECNDVSKCLPNNDGGNGVDQIRETHQGKGTFVTTSTTSNINPNEWIRN
jgi:RHS repeat-associated protein